jgi:hypothetical protein
MINWEYLAVNFIKQAGQWDRHADMNTGLLNCIDIIKRLAAAHIVVYIELKDGKATIQYTTTQYLQDVAADELMVAALVDANEPVFKKDIADNKDSFGALFPALCSAAFIPVSTGQHAGVVAMGWSAKQDFDHSFISFADVVQIRLNEMVQMAELNEELAILKKEQNSTIN